jgi:hypothetical protein
MKWWLVVAIATSGVHGEMGVNRERPVEQKGWISSCRESSTPFLTPEAASNINGGTELEFEGARFG